MPSVLHSPLPANMASECAKAAEILDSFVNSKDQGKRKKAPAAIPPDVLAQAKGFAIFNVFKVGAFASVKFGSGLVVARLPDGKWSAPSAIGTGGLGAGYQIGLGLTNFVLVLNTDKAVEQLSKAGSLTAGRDVDVAVGPYGGSSNYYRAAGIFTYSKTCGLYRGITFEGGVLLERSDANSKLYGSRVKAKQLLRGEIASPPEASKLMALLESDIFQGVKPDDSSSTAEMPSQPSQQTPHALAAELPPEQVSEPLVPELDSQMVDVHPIYELPADPITPRFELSAESPHNYSHDLPPYPEHTFSHQPVVLDLPEKTPLPSIDDKPQSEYPSKPPVMDYSTPPAETDVNLPAPLKIRKSPSPGQSPAPEAKLHDGRRDGNDELFFST